MRIFVTGATGYLGYHFVKAAIAQGHKVLCLRRTNSVSLFDSKIEDEIEWVADVNDQLKIAVERFQPDALFHAAWGGVRGAGREDDVTQETNITLSNRLFGLYPYKQIIALGSQAEYGYYEGPVSEDHKLVPLMQYAKAKVQVSKLLQKYCEKYHIEWQWIRIFTVFGERQTGGLIKLITEKCLAGEKEFKTTDGWQKYSFLYTSDFAQALCKVLGVRGKSGIYNLSQPADVYCNREILQKVKDFLHSDIQYKFGALPYPENQVMYMDGTVKKFEKAFGLIPHTNFDEALKSTIISIKEVFGR